MLITSGRYWEFRINLGWWTKRRGVQMAAIPDLYPSSIWESLKTVWFTVLKNSHNCILRSRAEALQATLSQHAQEEVTDKSLIRTREFCCLSASYSFLWHSSYKIKKAHSYKCEKGNFGVAFGFCYCKTGFRYSSHYLHLLLKF